MRESGMNQPNINVKHLRGLSLIRLPFQVVEAVVVLSVVALTEAGILDGPKEQSAKAKLPFGFAAEGLAVVEATASVNATAADNTEYEIGHA